MNRKQLETPFTPDQIKHRKGNFNRTLAYIEAPAIITRLNDALDAAWGFEILEHHILQDEVLVLGKLTAEGIVKTQFGSSQITRKKDSGEVISLGDDLKAAATDALKKAATLLGVGLQPPPDLVVAGAEMPLAAPVRDSQGNDMDMVLTGILDLVLMQTKTMTPIVVDFKIAKLAKSRAAPDEDIQLRMYAYLMGRAGYADLSEPLPCQFMVLRKLKTPKLETVTTFRTLDHMPRLEKLMHAVLTGIEHQVFIPCKSWLCSDCAYAEPCRDW